MSKRQSTHRKSTSRVSAVSDSERQSNRKSSRVSRRSSIESPHRSPIRASHQSPISAKDSPNLSQYFPSRKRSNSSPRNQLSLDLKYTRLKSPNPKFRKKLLNDAPVTYEDIENHLTQDLSQRTAKSDEVVLSPETKENDPKDDKNVDLKGLLCDLHSIMDEINDEDMEVPAEETVYHTTDILSVRSTAESNTSDGIESLAQMISGLATEEEIQSLSPIPCHSRDIPPILTTRSDPNIEDNEKSAKPEVIKPQDLSQEIVFEDDIEMNVESNGCESEDRLNESNGFDEDFENDSLDGILSQMTFPVEQSVTPVVVEDNVIVNCVDINSVVNNEEFDDVFTDEEDDGFESDGEFERMLTQIPNEQLVTPPDGSDSALDRSHSALDRSAHNASVDLINASMSSSGLLTLNEIIDLINS